MNKKNVITRSEPKDGGDIYVDEQREEEELEQSGDDKQKLPN